MHGVYRTVACCKMKSTRFNPVYFLCIIYISYIYIYIYIYIVTIFCRFIEYVGYINNTYNNTHIRIIFIKY